MSIEEWNRRYRAGERGDPKPAAVVVEAAGGLAPGEALDLACGAGRNAIFLARNGWRVTGIDGSVEAITITRRRVQKLGLHVESAVHDLESLPLPFGDHSFDLVCIVLYRQLSLIAEAERLVRPGGRIAASVKTTGSFALDPEVLLATLRHCRIMVSRMRSDTFEVIAEGSGVLIAGDTV